jgi:hypothetical protein
VERVARAVANAAERESIEEMLELLQKDVDATEESGSQWVINQGFLNLLTRLHTRISALE